MPEGVQPAIVLRRIPYRDSSLVLNLFTQEHGVRSVMAKGARKGSKSLPRGDLAGFHTLGVQLSGREGQSMMTLRRVEILSPRHGLMHHVAGSSAAQLMLEQVYRLFPAEDPHPGLFAALDGAMARLEAQASPLQVVGLWQGQLLHSLGFGWQTACCAGCGQGDDLIFFSPKRNQTVCRMCGIPHRDRLLPLAEGVLALMRGEMVEDLRAQRNLLALTCKLLERHGEKAFHALEPFLNVSGLR
ncbi:DNA repair protein RecO [Magnetococcus sp. PR-3]|uniref:DNA repair protein RecO n=1 Tax=Magnetococcus sp. PR-3 TaxID=3120355 RepID=UPI002FCE55DF